MDKEEKKITEKRRQEIEASDLKKKQERSAALLEQKQYRSALSLSAWQIAHNDESINISRKNAANALKKSQEAAAQFLRQSQEEDSATLKEANRISKQKIFEKDQVISWLTGGYSVEKHSE